MYFLQPIYWKHKNNLWQYISDSIYESDTGVAGIIPYCFFHMWDRVLGKVIHKGVFIFIGSLSVVTAVLLTFIPHFDYVGYRLVPVLGVGDFLH